jgi:hypothetical protein
MIKQPFLVLGGIHHPRATARTVGSEHGHVSVARCASPSAVTAAVTFRRCAAISAIADSVVSVVATLPRPPRLRSDKRLKDFGFSD